MLHVLVRLPHEVLNEVVGYVVPETLSLYASVSKEWQTVVERRLFGNLHVQNTDLTRFRRLLTPHRRAVLKRLEYQIVLPRHEASAGLRSAGIRDWTARSSQLQC